MLPKDFIIKAYHKVKQKLTPEHNMHTNKAEQYYFDSYYQHIDNLLKKNDNVLEIGCAYGRFTFPISEKVSKITVTDINNKYFKYIQKRISKSIDIAYREESIEETIKNLPENSFDVILCLELLYYLPNYESLIKEMHRLLKPGGVIITSHRTYGYYIYRFIKEGKYESAKSIINNNHKDYNCQTAEELEAIYSNVGFEVNKIEPIGILSGFGKDPFTKIANSNNFNQNKAECINHLENNLIAKYLFANNARYLLLIARKK